MTDDKTNRTIEITSKTDDDLSNNLARTVNELNFRRKADLAALKEKLGATTLPSVRESILKEVAEINNRVRLSYKF